MATVPFLETVWKGRQEARDQLWLAGCFRALWGRARQRLWCGLTIHPIPHTAALVPGPQESFPCPAQRCSELTPTVPRICCFALPMNTKHHLKKYSIFTMHAFVIYKCSHEHCPGVF